jgi:hypothetical protein
LLLIITPPTTGCGWELPLVLCVIGLVALGGGVPPVTAVWEILSPLAMDAMPSPIAGDDMVVTFKEFRAGVTSNV